MGAFPQLLVLTLVLAAVACSKAGVTTEDSSRPLPALPSTTLATSPGDSLPPQATTAATTATTEDVTTLPPPSTLPATTEPASTTLPDLTSSSTSSSTTSTTTTTLTTTSTTTSTTTTTTTMPPSTVAAPGIDHAPGVYHSVLSLALQPAAGATTCFATAPTTPACNPAKTGCAAGTLDTGGAIAVAVSSTIKAISCRAGWLDSSVASFAYELSLAGTVANATAPGYYVVSNDDTTTITTALSSPATPDFYCYTMDGTAPVCGASFCSAGTVLSTGSQLTVATASDWGGERNYRVAACKAGWTSSADSYAYTSNQRFFATDSGVAPSTIGLGRLGGDAFCQTQAGILGHSGGIWRPFIADRMGAVDSLTKPKILNPAGDVIFDDSAGVLMTSPGSVSLLVPFGPGGAGTLPMLTQVPETTSCGPFSNFGDPSTTLTWWYSSGFTTDPCMTSPGGLYCINLQQPRLAPQSAPSFVVATTDLYTLSFNGSTFDINFAVGMMQDADMFHVFLDTQGTSYTCGQTTPAVIAPITDYTLPYMPMTIANALQPNSDAYLQICAFNRSGYKASPQLLFHVPDIVTSLQLNAPTTVNAQTETEFCISGTEMFASGASQPYGLQGLNVMPYNTGSSYTGAPFDDARGTCFPLLPYDSNQTWPYSITFNACVTDGSYICTSATASATVTLTN